LASDGLWDKIENNEAVDLVKKIHESGFDKEEWYRRSS